MQALRDYILGIGAAAVICALTMSFAGKGSMQPLLKLISGLVLTFAAINPILSIAGGDWEALGMVYRDTGEEAASQGEALAARSLRDIIKEQTEAYILKRAGEMQLDISVTAQISAEDPPVPEAVLIRGELSPYEKSRLSWMLRQELAIPEENQRWT